jgi:alginate O-acetyltransferase complex protein AlgJ
LYRKTDNHWNDLGGFVAYREIMKQVSVKYPQLHALDFSDYTIEPQESDGGNMAIILNRQKEIRDMKYVFTPKFKNAGYTIRDCPYPIPDEFDKGSYFRGFYTKNDQLPSILIFHDSFGNSIQPFVKNSFSRSIFIWDKWQYKLNETIVEAEKPNIYITLTLESLLQSLSDNCEYR